VMPTDATTVGPIGDEITRGVANLFAEIRQGKDRMLLARRMKSPRRMILFRFNTVDV